MSNQTDASNQLSMEEQPKEETLQESPELKENGQEPVVQEATSTTPGEEVVTKRSIRLKIWRKFQEERFGFKQRMIFNRIPNFVGSDKAAELLAETPEFKNAKTVKVDINWAQDAVKLVALDAGKELYLPPARGLPIAYTKIECPEDADEKMRRKILQIVNWQKHRKDIDISEKIKLDMIVIGSVVVSRDGYRIGRGNGFVDLNIGILMHLGVITPETVIVTTVHDIQVVDTLPTELFQKYDTPVDLIVTPTEVIRVEKRLPRPQGIFWELLSERRLGIVPVLKILKENEESAGKVITLKSEDTDVETNVRQRYVQRRRKFTRGRSYRTRSETNNENGDKGRPQRNKRFNVRRRPTKSEGEKSSSENKENEQNQNKFMRKKRINSNDFCVKVSKIDRGIRMRDLKVELRKRQCIPAFFNWKGAYGKCYLHFAARKEGVEKDDEIQKVLDSLNDLSLTVPNGKTVPLEVELLQFKVNDQLEPVNTSTV